MAPDGYPDFSPYGMENPNIEPPKDNPFEAPSDSDSGSCSGLGGSGGSPEKNEPPLDLKASVDGLSGSGDASEKDSSIDTGTGTEAGSDSDAGAMETSSRGSCWFRSRDYRRPLAEQRTSSTLWKASEAPNGLSQLVDHIGGPQKLLDLFAGLGDEGLEIDIEVPGVGHIGTGPASEGTDLSRFWEAEVRFRKRIRLGPQATGEGGDGCWYKGVVGEIACVVGGAVGAVGKIVAGVVDGLGHTVKKFLSRRCRG
ncbi:hypothetical protein BKA56DRAFT_668363 [Ilyonectria sp. MPI-CAGE-AT-0026]|nr:hypothetical protein BKA56DRAFT_668363 [Ilyonectria sp. MPI-CAGE-AT-0026]